MQHFFLRTHAVALHVQFVLEARDRVLQLSHLLFVVLLQGPELLVVGVLESGGRGGELLLLLVELSLEVLALEFILDDVALILIDQEVTAHL